MKVVGGHEIVRAVHGDRQHPLGLIKLIGHHAIGAGHLHRHERRHFLGDVELSEIDELHAVLGGQSIAEIFVRNVAQLDENGAHGAALLLLDFQSLVHLGAAQLAHFYEDASELPAAELLNRRHFARFQRTCAGASLACFGSV